MNKDKWLDIAGMVAMGMVSGASFIVWYGFLGSL